MSLNGYDISNNQGNIDNSIVPGDFVIIKATEGVGWTDPNCDANYQQAKKAGKRLGVYHFARPDGNGATAEADWFVSQVRGYVKEAVLVLDLEVKPITPAWAKEWLDRVYSLTGVHPWIYMSQSPASTGDWSSVWADYGLWMAQYPNNNIVNGYAVPGTPSVKGDWTIVAWQYTSHGRLPGWGGNLDLNIFYGTTASWDKYAGKNAAPPVEVHPPQPDPTPVPPPVATPVPIPPTPDYLEENNTLLKQILAVVNWIKDLLGKVFK